MITKEILLIFGCVLITQSAPRTRPEAFGPCIGMDCLHGVLMHKDGAQGDSHKAEDDYAKLQALDAVQGKESAPCEGTDCLHGVLMHGDEAQGVVHMEQKAGPVEPPKQLGPCEGMDCLHGVLMHGDEEPGMKHKSEDTAFREDSKADPPKQQGPCEGMDCLHGVMAHGDATIGLEHMEAGDDETEITSTEKPFDNLEPKASNLDPEMFLHGGEGFHAHDAKNEQDTKVESKKQMAPDFESILHGDNEGHVHDPTGNPKRAPLKVVSTAEDPERLLHGSNGDHSHTETPKDNDKTPKGIPGITDPDAFLHGHHEGVPKLGTVTDAEREDYLQWKEEQEKKEDSDAGWGFTLASISDTILTDIDLMKRRWLAKFWGEEENNGQKEKNMEEAKPEPEPLGDQEIGMDDMRHELKNIGSTEPLDHNHGHAEKAEKQKSREKDIGL